MTYYTSRYNFFVSRPDGIVGYNARTGVFALLREDIAKAMDTPPNSEVSVPCDEANQLLGMGFIHEGQEQEELEEEYAAAQQSDLLSLTILPTLECNFRCEYCYQDHLCSQMDSNTIAATEKFVERVILAGKKRLSLTWFGGEPLLALDVVASLGRKLQELAYRHSVSIIGSRIITNGTLLSSVAASKLQSLGIQEAQVSVDSLYFEPGTARGVIEHDGAPSIIVRNVLAARDLLKIRIRVNVSPSNRHEIPEIIGQLSRLGLSKDFQLKRVHRDGLEFSAATPKVRRSLPVLNDSAIFLQRREFADIEMTTFFSDPSNLATLANRLIPKVHYCGATAGNLYVIAPDGSVSRCWHSANIREEALGTVYDALQVDDNQLAQRWLRYRPSEHLGCQTCKVMPLCRGGCAHPRLFMDSSTVPCEPIKFQIRRAVDILGRTLELPNRSAE